MNANRRRVTRPRRRLPAVSPAKLSQKTRSRQLRATRRLTRCADNRRLGCGNIAIILVGQRVGIGLPVLPDRHGSLSGPNPPSPSRLIAR
jgi:hypothetical protein